MPKNKLVAISPEDYRAGLSYPWPPGELPRIEEQGSGFAEWAAAQGWPRAGILKIGDQRVVVEDVTRMLLDGLFTVVGTIRTKAEIDRENEVRDAKD